MIKYLLTTILLFSLNCTASEISIDKFKIKMENIPTKEKIIIKNMSDTETYVSVGFNRNNRNKLSKTT